MSIHEATCSESAYEERSVRFDLTDREIQNHRAYPHSPVRRWRPESMRVTWERRWGSIGWEDWKVSVGLSGKTIKRDGTRGVYTIHQQFSDLELLPADLREVVRRVRPDGSITS